MELDPGDIVEMSGYSVEAIQTNHSVPSLGYCLREDKRLGQIQPRGSHCAWRTIRAALREASARSVGRGRRQIDQS